jgi:hypothetical protein
LLSAAGNIVVLFSLEETAMQLAGPNELGYANAALITSLFNVLAAKGILRVDDLETIVAQAIESLEPTRHITSVNGAIAFITNSIVPQLPKTGP